MELAGLPNELVHFMKHLVHTWKTKVILNTEKDTLITNPIYIKRGIYQGDAISPMLFCISLIPLSQLINESATGYKIKNTTRDITHLLYMDDLKLVSHSKIQMKKMVDIVQMFSRDIGMQFGLDKCATISMNKGELDLTLDISTDEGVIKGLQFDEFYKYLGVEEGQQINNKGMKQLVQKEYINRVRKICQTQLNAKNKLEAIGVFAVPVIQYSFGILSWTLAEIQELDRKTRKILNMKGLLHPRADIDRLYTPRSAGGRGLKQLEAAFHISIYNLGMYIQQAAAKDPLMELVRIHDLKKHSKLSVIQKASKIEKDKLNAEQIQKSLKEKKYILRCTILQELQSRWESKEMHGQLFRDMKNIPHDGEQSWNWLRTGSLKPETESLLTAAQEQAIRTKYFNKKILRSTDDDRCRLCSTHPETIAHIISACPALAKHEYIIRHNKVCTLIHHSLCVHYNCPVGSKNWYEHIPPKVVSNKNDEVTILYDHPVITDRNVAANRPDIIIKTNERTYLVDISIPEDRNIVNKEAEKCLKYKDLKIEVERMWNRKAAVIPVVVGATGFVTKNLEKYIEQIPGKHSISEIQKTAVIGTAHILRKVLT